MSRAQIDFRFAPPARWTAICRPDDPHKTLVREDGALLYDFVKLSHEAWHFGRVVELRAQTGDTALRASQRTETAARAIVVTTVEYPSLELEMTAFAYASAAGRYDVVLWSVHNTSAREVLTGLRLDVHDRTCATVIGPAPAHRACLRSLDDLPSLPMWIDDTATSDDESLGPVALISHPDRLSVTHPHRFLPACALATTPHILQPGEQCSGAIVLPQPPEQPPESIAETNLDQRWAHQALRGTRQFWDELPALNLPLQVPDPDVQDMLVACVRNILQAREIKGGLPVPQVGAAVYRGLWIADGHFILEAARYLHQDDAAEAGIVGLRQRAKPSGAITEMTPDQHLKETAIAICTLVRQAELGADPDASLRAYWPVIRRATHYLQRLHEQANALPAEHPLHGLMPPAFADGGAAGERAEFTTTVWTLAGLKAATRAARLLEQRDDELLCTALFDELKATYRARAAASRRRTSSGVEYTPTIPEGSGSHHLIAGVADDLVSRWRCIQPGTATWAISQAIWPGEILEPDDPEVAELLALFDELDNEQGIPAETGWLPYASVWPYFASFAAHVWLYAGRPDKAVEYLYAFANHAGPTRVWREEQSLAATGNGQLCGDMPHNWASAEFIRLVRHLLVFERGDVLQLLPALPPAWLARDGQLGVDRTPTRFGPVTLAASWHIEPDLTTVRVRFERLDNRSHVRPDAQVLHVPQPPARNGTPWRPPAVTLNGREVSPAPRGSLHIPTDEASLELTYLPAG